MILSNEDEARAFCAGLTDQAGMERLENFASLLLKENEQQNLIAKTSEASVWTRHFADSAQLLSYVPRGTQSWLDLGTGAGFPGLVVAAMQPERHYVLVESRKKRAEFLTLAASALELTNCEVRGERLETVSALDASVISARAFAPLQKLLDLAARFSTRDTVWLLPKGRSAGQELSSLPPKLRSKFHLEHSVTDGEAGILVGKGRLEQP
ncbi:16S rRNA (guanine(527)-N(7))-methyltransferase RsmG [Tsuneonella sp. HG222]